MRSRLALAVLVGAAGLGAGIGLLAVAAWLITRAAARPPILELMTAVVAVRALALGKGVLRYLERLLAHDVAFRALAGMRVAVYRQLVRIAPAGLAGYRRGDLLTRLVDDVAAVQDRYARILAPGWSAALAALLAAGIATALLPIAGVVLATGLAVAGLGVPAAARALTGWADRRLTRLRAGLAERIVETADAGLELTVLGAAPDRLAGSAAAAGLLAAAESRLAWVHGLAGGLGSVVTGLTIGATVLVGTPAVADGRLDGPGFAVLALLPLAAFDAVGGLGSAIRDGTRVTAALDRVDRLMRAPAPIVEPGPDDTDPPTIGTGIVLRDVSARWPGADRDALTQIDVDLPAGKRIAVVGPSGSGKSTLLAVLLRFCPHTGQVRVGDAPLQAVSETRLRALVGFAAAEAHIFDATLAANLRLARPDARDAELRAVLDRAGLLEWVDALPRGLEAAVGEHGRRLSGGQRQRLALARALLADVPVLLCDEPDGQLQPDLADRLVADLLRSAGHRTVVLATHRPAALGGVDEILVLADGRIVQRGTHSALSASTGWYRDQFLGRTGLEGDPGVVVPVAEVVDDIDHAVHPLSQL